MSHDPQYDGIQPARDGRPPMARDHDLDDDDLDAIRIDGPRENRSLAVWSHWGGYLTWIILPMIFYIGEKDKRSLVAWHAREAINFQITIALYFLLVSVLPTPLFFLAMVEPWLALAAPGIIFVLVIVLAVYELMVVILAGLAASRGQRYRYPLTIRFVPKPSEEPNPYDDRE